MSEVNIAELGVDPSIISQNPEVVSGAPVFPGTRVPVSHLLEHLALGETIEDFTREYPPVTREQVLKALKLAFERTIGPLDEDLV